MNSLPPPPDLLRQWRQEEGLADPSALQPLALLRRGGLFGAGLVGLALLVGLAVLLRSRQVDGQIDQLAPVAAMSRSLEERLQATRRQRLALERGNRHLAEGLVAVRSGSALLSDLQRRTPAGLQLTELKVLPDTLSLKGQARDPGALQRINTLVLALQRSPFIEAQGLKLRSASRLDPKDTANDRQPPLELVAFELTAPFRERDSRREAALLRQLEAQGMAARLQVLEREGLLP